MALSIWAFRSPRDGYFAGVLLAATEAEARTAAFQLHDDVPEFGGDEAGRRTRYGHTDPTGSDYDVVELGASYVGADGEGHLEVDF